MPFQMHLDSRTASPDRNYRKFSIDRPGNIIFVGHHLSTATGVRCLIRTITLAGAVLEISPNVDVPHHFFLEIQGIDDEIGCTLVGRDNELTTISFNMLISPNFLQHVIRMSFEAA